MRPFVPGTFVHNRFGARRLKHVLLLATLLLIASRSLFAQSQLLQSGSVEHGSIRRVDATTGIISTFVGNGSYGFSDGGAATSARLYQPLGVAVDKTGNLFIADHDNDRIRVVFACVTMTSVTLLLPANNSSSAMTSPKLAWRPVNGAFTYDVFIDIVNPPQKLVAADVRAPTYSPSNLEPLTAYYWQVVAKGDRFCTPFSSARSPVWSFTTAGGCSTPGTLTAITTN